MSFCKLLSYFFFFTFLKFGMPQSPTFLQSNCSSNDTFSDNSDYQSNLSSLLGNLPPSNIKEFYNITAGVLNNTVYGLYLCRGDIPLQLCNKCVAVATERVSKECPNYKEAIIWYDECLLRYSNRSFFSKVDTRPRHTLWNTVNATDQANFMRLMFRTMNETADKAANFPVGAKKFATKQLNISGSQTLYCLAQCTPDLSPQDCRMCLSGAIGDLHWCCEGMKGGRILYPSCNVRYESYPFYNSPATPPSPTPAPATWGAPAPAGTKLEGKGKGQSRTIIIVLVLVVGSVMLFGFGCYFLQRRKSKSYKAILKKKFGIESASRESLQSSLATSIESLKFSLVTIEAATNKFSHDNKIGKGGFGEVYKGVLFDGREIAIKRLSKHSGQGETEFKNEILLIAKLQHRNLVALLGFCLEEQEKILVYEYVANKSLDYFLFGPQNRRILNWLERYKILGGIARGIQYLHEHSRLKVIHRDLKPSNILLDDNMNPKISDFGLARMVAIDETKGSTNSIVGTYGYMSPEYAMLGQFSEKSDVFSFGVMVLEIISGKRNADFYESQNVVSLLSYVWKQWMNKKPLEILDSNLFEVHSKAEVAKCIQIGLLCVQENPDARPSIATVVSYLGSDSIQLPFPQEPAFSMHGRVKPTVRAKESSSGSGQYASNPSVNDVSISEISPR